MRGHHISKLFPFQICKKLQYHERIVRLEDVIYRDNLVYIVFEYLSGGDLFEGILARNWYSEKQSCLLAKQILQALEHCHRLRVIHRVIVQQLIFK